MRETVPDPNFPRINDIRSSSYGINIRFENISRFQSVKFFKEGCENAGGMWLGETSEKDYFGDIKVACQLDHVERILVDSTRARTEWFKKDIDSVRQIVKKIGDVQREHDAIAGKRGKKKDTYNLKLELEKLKREQAKAIEEYNDRLQLGELAEKYYKDENFDVVLVENSNLKQGDYSTGRVFLFGWITGSSGIRLHYTNDSVERFSKLLEEKHPEFSKELREIEREVVHVAEDRGDLVVNVDNRSKTSLSANEDLKKFIEPRGGVFPISTGSADISFNVGKRCIINGVSHVDKFESWVFQGYPDWDGGGNKKKKRVFNRLLAPMSDFTIDCFI